MQLFYEAQMQGELSDPTDENIEFRKFVPISSVGSKYPLPPIVEEVVGDLN